jgi:hypothetical protein
VARYRPNKKISLPYADGTLAAEFPKLPDGPVCNTGDCAKVVTSPRLSLNKQKSSADGVGWAVYTLASICQYAQEAGGSVHIEVKRLYFQVKDDTYDG